MSAARRLALLTLALASPFAARAASVEIRPAGPTIPANLLRFELRFERPQPLPFEPGRLTLRDADGREIAGALLDLALPSADGRRVTVLMDPGRVKSGAGPNRDAGRALQEGASVSLRFEPAGCTGTILLALHREAGLSVEPQDARLMLSAILSDTLHFRSPTTTPQDREAVAFLAPIAGVEDVEAYALAMFAAKSDLGDTSAETLLRMDYKVFPFGDAAQPQTWGIGVIETTNPAYVFGRQQELLAAMDQVKAEDTLSGVLLSVVDILNETNRTLVLGATEAKVLREAFGVEAEGQVADLGARISRKKQIVPTLEKYFTPEA